MTEINWGVLSNLGQVAPIQSAQPIAQSAPAPELSGVGSSSDIGDALKRLFGKNPSSGSGDGLLGGIGNSLKGLFGQNPVSIASQALTNQMAQMPQTDLANSLIRPPIQSPQQQYQASPAVQKTNQALSIPNMQNMRAQASPTQGLLNLKSPEMNPNNIQNINNVYNKTSQTNAIHRAVTAASLPGATPFDIATSYMGKGSNNHPEVLQQFFNKSMGQSVDPRTTPWCAAFANSVLMSTGHGGTGSLAARSFLNYGRPTDSPTKGDVVVMSDLTGRNDPSKGHVGFFSGYSEDGRKVKVLGGNESGQVMVREYPVSKVLGYRVPPTPQELTEKASMKSARNGGPNQQAFQLASLGKHPSNIPPVPIEPQETNPPAIPYEDYEKYVKALDGGLDDYE